MPVLNVAFATPTTTWGTLWKSISSCCTSVVASCATCVYSTVTSTGRGCQQTCRPDSRRCACCTLRSRREGSLQLSFFPLGAAQECLKLYTFTVLISRYKSCHVMFSNTRLDVSNYCTTWIYSGSHWSPPTSITSELLIFYPSLSSCRYVLVYLGSTIKIRVKLKLEKGKSKIHSL